MNHHSAFQAFAVATGLFAAVVITGCGSLSTETIQYLGVNRHPPSDASRIVILHEPPERAHEKLGEVVASVSLKPSPSVEKIESALRRRAADLGAEAILLVKDQVEMTGSWVSGPYWAPTISPILSRVIVGIAIRYLE